MDQTTELYLEELVETFMRERRSFTSLDIANTAKEEGYRIRNHEVANWLRRNVITIAYDGGYLYNQTLIRVDSKAVGMTYAYCYHHHTVDTDEYLDRDQNPKSFLKVIPNMSSNLTRGFAAAARSGVDTGHVTTRGFDTRQEARNFARTNPSYRFKDCGRGNPYRWVCVPRKNHS